MNLSELTEEQLLSKIRKCREALDVMTNNPSFTNSVRQALEQYENEYQERLYMDKVNSDLEKNPPGAIEIGSIQDLNDK